MTATLAVFRREFAAYLHTPLAWVLIAAFVFASGAFAFQLGGLFEAGEASLDAMFVFHPWLHLVFMPAIAMRLWAEDARGGTMETLLALPVPTHALVFGKHLAAWTVAGAALVLTMPLWLSISLIGRPDHGSIALAYLVSFLIAGGHLALGGAISALTSSQVVAFVIAGLIAFGFTAAGLPVVQETVQATLGVDAAQIVAGFSLLELMSNGQDGLVTASGLIFILSFTALWLGLAWIAIDARRSGPR
jgi:ABC-2 type transport system permease protein